VLFSVYYQTRENGEYLREVVKASGAGQLKSVEDLSALTAAPGADVVLLEYADNNLCLDRWIARTTAASRHPEIFLLVQEMSAQVIWKALRLRAQECFTRNMQPEDFRKAVRRVRADRAVRGWLNPPDN